MITKSALQHHHRVVHGTTVAKLNQLLRDQDITLSDTATEEERERALLKSISLQREIHQFGGSHINHS